MLPSVMDAPGSALLDSSKRPQQNLNQCRSHRSRPDRSPISDHPLFHRSLTGRLRQTRQCDVGEEGGTEAIDTQAQEGEQERKKERNRAVRQRENGSGRKVMEGRMGGGTDGEMEGPALTLANWEPGPGTAGNCRL